MMKEDMNSPHPLLIAFGQGFVISVGSRLTLGFFLHGGEIELKECLAIRIYN